MLRKANLFYPYKKDCRTYKLFCCIHLRVTVHVLFFCFSVCATCNRPFGQAARSGRVGELPMG